MCGIIGIVGHNNCPQDKLLNLIEHRGPDSRGAFEHENIFLGHTRLSIQDLSAHGNQPMYSNDGRYVIIFNGEIYNHWEVRKEIEQDYDFKSTCDTETILYSYIKYGESFLEKLNGIFALAIYDIKEKEIFLARDQMGVKPFYFYRDSHKFLFSSELKSFLPLEIDKQISIKALANYLTFLWSPGTLTPFSGVEKLLPGHYLKFKLADFGIAKVVKYFQIPFTGEYSADNEEVLADLLEQKLIAAVKRQMLADVPVGFFLSGGLDSSLLVAIARKIYPERSLSCFTIDTGDAGEGFTDDLPYAKRVANYLNVELNILKAEINIFRDFDKMVWHLDEPQADAAPLNVLNISRFAREKGIKVLIGGTGADDLFSGYRRHQALTLEKYFNKIPVSFAKLFLKSINTLSVKYPFFRRIRKLMTDIDKEPNVRMAGYFRWLPYNTLKSLLQPGILQQLGNIDPIDQLTSMQGDIPLENNLLNKMLYYEMKSFLVDHNLNYTDKLAMAAGVEARVPYLDMELVEFSTQIPPDLKMKGKETKYLLKKVAERYLPLSVIYRPKTGFGAPVRKWILNDLEPMINERLSYEKINERGIFNPDAIWKLIEDNKSGKVDASYIILALLAIESWMIQFVDTQKYSKN
jgi:asparagine synthase (glutamine-hydrolysing)